MIIVKAYIGKIELTASQKSALLEAAKDLKMLGYSHMFVDAYRPVFAEDLVLEYVAVKNVGTDNEWSQRAFVGKKGGLSNGIGKNNKSGYGMSQGNSLEYTLPNIDKFVTVTI